MPIKIRHGVIFDSECDFIVNTTNSIGVMGKGLALEFKGRYPNICSAYNRWSKTVNHTPPYKLLPVKFCKHIVMFPTKVHWRNPSRWEYLHLGLDQIVKNLPKDKSIAFPLLGARNGGLPKDKVIELIKEKMKDHPSKVEIWIWKPDK